MLLLSRKNLSKNCIAVSFSELFLPKNKLTFPNAAQVTGLFLLYKYAFS